MTKEGLYELIEERKLELEDQMKNSDPDLDRLKEIVEGHNLYKVEDLAKLDLVELFPLILKYENQDLYDYYKKNFDGRWENFMQYGFYNENRYDGITKGKMLLAILGAGNVFANYFLLKTGNQNYTLHERAQLADNFSVYNYDLEDVLKRFPGFKVLSDSIKTDENKKVILEHIQWLSKLVIFNCKPIFACELLIIFKCHIDDYNYALEKRTLFEENCEELKYLSSAADVAVKKISDLSKKNLNLSGALSHFNKMYNREFQKRETFLKKLKRTINKYDSFKESFESTLAKNEVVDGAKLVDGLDEDIKKGALGIIYEHNKKFYDEQAIKYQSLQQNEVLQFQLLLEGYGIEPGTYVVSDIMRYSVDSTRRFLDKLKEINIVEPDLLVDILRFGNIDAINNSYKYIKRGIISTEFLKENIEFFDSESGIYKNAMDNILSFLDNSFSPNYVSSNQDVLLIENSLLVTNLDTIKQYGFSKDIKSCLLNESNLAELFDVIIELGYEDRLESDLDIASYGRDRWKRIELLKQLGVVVEDSELDDILESNSFFVADDELDNYIFRAFDGVSGQLSSSNDVKGDLAILEQYNETSRTYNINGVIISKNKVIRNLSRLNKESISQQEKLFVSILGDRSITQGEYDEVIKAFDVKDYKIFNKINCN